MSGPMTEERLNDIRRRGGSYCCIHDDCTSNTVRQLVSEVDRLRAENAAAVKVCEALCDYTTNGRCSDQDWLVVHDALREWATSQPGPEETEKVKT